MRRDHIDGERLRTLPFLGGCEWHETIASTNDRAIEIAQRRAARLPYLVLAEEQTAGRGRGAHRWWTGRGSLAFSLLVGDETLPPRLTAGDPAAAARGMTALAAAVAIARTTNECAGGSNVGIHWPNDVYVANRKLSGVLVEVLADGRQVIGIGLNVNNVTEDAPPEIAPRVVAIRELAGGPLDRTAVLINLLGALQQTLAALRGDAAAIGRCAHALCRQRGQRLFVQSGNEVIDGVCQGIAADGGLVLDTATGRRCIYTGSVSRIG